MVRDRERERERGREREREREKGRERGRDLECNLTRKKVNNYIKSRQVD